VYERVEKLGDKLIGANNVIDWEKFQPIVEDMYVNRSEMVVGLIMMKY